MICPICNRNSVNRSQEETACEVCNSILKRNEKLELKIIKNKVPFALDNLVFGMIGIAGVLISFFIFFKKNDDAFFSIGWIYLFGPILGLLQHLLFYKSEDFQNFIDLHKALISGRIRHYDFGSKFFVYSLLTIQFIGIAFIIIYYVN